MTQFSWTGGLHETRTVLQMLRESAYDSPGLIDDDQYQGWHILVATAGAATCFTGGMSTVRHLPSGYAIESAMLAEQAGAGVDRLSVILERLALALGRKHWA